VERSGRGLFSVTNNMSFVWRPKKSHAKISASLVGVFAAIPNTND